MVFAKLKSVLICTAVLGGFYPGLLWAENTHSAPTAQSSTPVEPGEKVPMSRHLEIRNLETASAPRFVSPKLPDFADDKATVLFTFQDSSLSAGAPFQTAVRGDQSYPSVKSRSVAIAFAHEGWAVKHQLKVVNNTDIHGHTSSVYFLYYDLSRAELAKLLEEHKNIEYRYIVDGVWMADPLNPQSVKKLNGAMVSYVEPSMAPPPATISPEVLPPTAFDRNKFSTSNPERAILSSIANTKQPRTVILRVLANPGDTINVAGTFNAFDPWLNELRPVRRDARNPDKLVYEIELRLLAGQYFYHFVINGANVLDPLNVKRGSGPEGRQYSLLSVN